MKIAIIAPSSIPFTIGGAEKFWWGLQSAINQYSSHQAELIKMPTREACFIDLIDSYKMFSELDLLHFDCVISSKYPAWMVSHPMHYCYMQHRLRGLYDTYHLTGLAIDIDRRLAKEYPQLSILLELISKTEVTDDDLQQFWQQWAAIKQQLISQQIAETVFAFPGSLTRKIIHFLDRSALNNKKIRAFSAISHNVAGRADYFPENVCIDVNHHPSDIVDFRSTAKDKTKRAYIFTISRMDQPKRIHLLIAAFKKTTADVDFRIAGTGPELTQLKQQAIDDRRIQFLGRITDEQLIEEYAGTLFVPFIPYDEDYGLITIEAMQSKKAVLTTNDAGGVNEFVEQGINGYSVAPEISALTQAMQKMLKESQKTVQMGQNAYIKVQSINWQTTIIKLLNNCGQKDQRSNSENKVVRKHIVVVLTFPVWPPYGGGQSRVYNLYKEVARYHDITIISLLNQEKLYGELKADQTVKYQELAIAPNMREIRVVKSQQQMDYEYELHDLLQQSVEDIACIEGYTKTPWFTEVLKKICISADLVIASHPYLSNAIAEVWQGETWYEAHNVEADMKAAILGKTDAAKIWIKKTAQIEQQSCNMSNKILTCSEQDGEKIAHDYEQSIEKIMVIPNGVTLPDNKKTIKNITKKYINNKSNRPFIAIFMGSWHGPNIEAVKHLIHIASHCPDTEFLIMGSVCQHSIAQKMGNNMTALGVVSEIEKKLYLECADIALNPITSGSGTNLKLLDYCAHSLPVLSTPFGLRGLNLLPEQEVFSRKIELFSELLNLFSQKDKKNLMAEMTEKAYKKIKNEYIWSIIAQKIIIELDA